MSKCAVFITSKSRRLYWTLFCPKYCAEAEAAKTRIRTAETTATTARREAHMTGPCEATPPPWRISGRQLQAQRQRRALGKNGGEAARSGSVFLGVFRAFAALDDVPLGEEN